MSDNARTVILIVEDDQPIRETVQDLLESEGYRVITASNGLEGIERFQEMKDPCVVLLDLMMPVMDGWEVLSRIRGSADPRRSSSPVVIFSAAGDVARAATARGASDFVKKPIDLDRLLETIERHCTEH